MANNIRVNFLYFGCFFIILAIIHGFHAHVIEQGSVSLKVAFIFYALCQSFLEAAFLALLGGLIARRSKVYQWLFVAFTLVLLLMHLIDFPLVRLMDLSIWHSLGLVLGETWENFIEMLYATHMKMSTWISAALSLAVIFFIGLAGYRLSEKRAAEVPKRAFAALFVLLPLTMLLCDSMLIRGTSSNHWHIHEKALPWKRTLLSAREPTLSLKAPLKPLLSEEQTLDRLAKLPVEDAKRPDIFIFVVESLREDFLNAETAPNLTEFEKITTSAVQNIASANGTQLTWFSAFFGKYPFYFASYQQQGWQSGSPALGLLKKMGYEIEVFAAVRLAYYKMDRLIFGEQLQLADALHLFPPDDLIPAHESDRRAMHKLMERANEEGHQGGRCYIVFLESTHFDYSWPQEHTALPINYLDLLVSKDSLSSVQNRYRSAIHYLDELFGEFVTSLKQSNRWEDAVVAFTSDHGEEFYEEGHLFHASNLSQAQTRVPLYFKLGNRPKEAGAAMGSHIDLFPTIFHYLLAEGSCSDLFDGESILSAKKWPYALTGRYNGSRNPYEFCLESPRQKLIAQFTQPNALFSAQDLRIMQLRDAQDLPLEVSMDAIELEFRAGLNHLFSY